MAENKERSLDIANNALVVTTKEVYMPSFVAGDTSAVLNQLSDAFLESQFRTVIHCFIDNLYIVGDKSIQAQQIRGYGLPSDIKPLIKRLGFYTNVLIAFYPYCKVSKSLFIRAIYPELAKGFSKEYFDVNNANTLAQTKQRGYTLESMGIDKKAVYLQEFRSCILNNAGPSDVIKKIKEQEERDRKEKERLDRLERERQIRLTKIRTKRREIDELNQKKNAPLGFNEKVDAIEQDIKNRQIEI